MEPTRPDPESRKIIIDACPTDLQELMRERNMLKAVFASIGDAVYYTDTDRRILAWNKAAEELTGWSLEEVKGKACRDLLQHQDDKGNVLCDTMCPLLDSMQGKKEIFYSEVWLHTKKGLLKAIEVSCSPVINEKGETLGAVEVFRDRTRQKELERLKEEFAATITHDLKSPLASMMGFAELLSNPKHGEIAPQKLEYVQKIRQSGELLLALIGNIVDSSRIEAGQMIYNFEDFPLDKLLKELSDMFLPLAAQNQITLEFSCPPATWVYADRNRIRQVFHNLISNALRYTPEGGAISSSAKPEGEKIVITVSDTGRGIPPSELGKLFKKFSQLKGEKRGTGLGLYIVKNFLAAHNSEITLESEVDKGTRFFFSLTKGKPGKTAGFRPGKLLLVGDDAGSARLAAFALTGAGYSLETSKSGLEALQKAAGLKPDLILAYRPLPDLTIEEFRHSLLLDPETKNIPLVLLSALNLPEWQSTFAAIIPLPLDTRSLSQTVQKILAA